MKKVFLILAVALLLCAVQLARPQTSAYAVALEVVEAAPGRIVARAINGTLPQMVIYAAGDNDPGDILLAVLDDAGTPEDLTDDTIMDIRWSGLRF